MKKSFLAIILIVCMVFSILPMTVFAASDTDVTCPVEGASNTDSNEVAAISCCAGSIICSSQGTIVDGFYANEKAALRSTNTSGTCGTNLVWSFDADTGVLRISGQGDMDDYYSDDAPWDDFGNTIQFVSIEEGVTSIGASAFAGCFSLEEVSISNSVERIGWAAFAMTNIKSITIPSGVTQISAGAFSLCDSLSSIEVSAANTAYCVDSNGVLYNKAKTTLVYCPSGYSGKFTVPDTVKAIEDCAFYDADQVTVITIPYSVTSIGETAFGGFQYGSSGDWFCHWSSGRKTSVLVSNDNPVYSSDTYGSLFNKDKTQLLRCAEGIEFYSVPSTVTKIGRNAFSCSNIESVEIPNSVNCIEAGCFSQCESLTAVVLDGENAAYCSENGILFDKNKTKLLWFPSDRTGSYTIPSSVTEVCRFAFNNSSLDNIIMQEGLQSVHDFAFLFAANITTFSFPKSVNFIGNCALLNYSKDKTITILNPSCEISDFPGTLDWGSIVYSYAGSTAQAYAEKYGYEFRLIGTEPEDFNTFFVNNYFDSISDLYSYESVAQEIKTSSFQIIWNTCLQALSNSEYIDLSKLKNHPEYYYEVVLIESIAQTELCDDYLSSLIGEASDLLLDAVDVFVSYDANFNSYDDIFETKLNEAVDFFGGTSDEVHALYQVYGKYTSYKDFYTVAEFIYDAYKEVDGTYGDFLASLSNYQVSGQASKELIEALRYLRSTLEDSLSQEDQYIVAAIDQFLQSYTASQDEQLANFFKETVDEQLRGVFFAAIKDAIPIFKNAYNLETIGFGIAFTLSDALFPTTMSSESYCKIYADYAMECVLRNAMLSACSSRSTVGDDVIVGLYDLLGYTYKHEIQVAEVLAEQLYHDGLLNGLRNLFTDREERYNYDKACIKAYQADLYQILGKKTDAKREYGLETGASQIVTLVFMQNGKVIECSELAIQTGSTYSPPTGTLNLGGFINTKIEIGTFYTDAALTVPYDESQKVYSPVSLYCNVNLTDLITNTPIIVDYSTGICVTQAGIDETTFLQTEENLNGSSYDLVKDTLKSNAFSLYDISLLKNGTPVQPTETVTVRIPCSEADTSGTGKVYRVEKNGIFTDMNSWIEDDYYCFDTNHFSEYVVLFEPLTDLKIAMNIVDLRISNDAGTRLVRIQETNLGDFAADALYYLFNETEGLDCDLAVINGGAIRANLPKGDVTYKSCKTVLPFGNIACLISVTGQQIIDALEWGAKAVGVGENGGFLQVSGVTYEIHSYIPSTVQQLSDNYWAGAPTGDYRVQNVKIYDKELGEYVPIDPEAQYNLAGDSYTLCDGGYGFNMFDGAVLVKDDVMEDYLVLANYAKSFPNATIEATNSVLGSDYSNINGEGRIKIVTKQCEHVWNQGETTLTPTCTEMGVKTFICTQCGQSKTETIAALGHAWDNGTVTTQPTEAKEGVKTFTCTRCGATKTEPIARLTDCDGGNNCPSHGFTDVPEPPHWMHAGIDFAVENSLFLGTSDTTFSPNEAMTRAMLVTVLWRLEGKPEAGTQTGFKDVPAGEYYAQPVAWAAANGIVMGTSDATFSPNGKITREQMAAILYRYAQKKGYDTTKSADLSKFPDNGKVSSYARQSLAWANAEGLINGDEQANGTVLLDPAGNAIRAQVAAILMRYVQNIVE